MIINEVRNQYDNEPSRNLKMSDFTIGQQKDLVLNLCLKYPKQEADIKDFKRILFPNDTKEDIKLLLTQISEHDTEVVKIRSTRFDLNLQTNERTKSFIKNGGFTKVEEELIKSTRKKESENKSIINNYNNVGQVIQDSDFSNSQNTNRVNEQPKIKLDQKAPFKKAWELFSNNKLILLIIGVLIEEITWGNIWKFISDLF